jgi:hypothetical protein
VEELKMSDDAETKTYPGVELAYGFAVESYGQSQKRFEAWDDRLQTLTALIVGISLAFPAVMNPEKRNFASWWFKVAFGVFLLVIGLGIYGRLAGKLKLVDPQRLYQKFLHLGDWEFKKTFIYFAGENYSANLDQISRKHHIAVAMSFLFFLEVALLVAWAA